MENLEQGYELIYIEDRRICKSEIMDRASVKPFIKWAGGKSELIEEIRKFYPVELGGNIDKYCEPFIGGGAVLFDILSNFNMNRIYISDINKELIETYKTIKEEVEDLIYLLKSFEREYIPLDVEKRKEYFYLKRDTFNRYIENKERNAINLAALFIFLNRTCFNGLYRVNSRGLFNVPMGSYKNPKICDESNLREISKKLEKVEIVCSNYEKSIEFIDKNTFVYLDPPYRPISKTSSFTAYSKYRFGDEEQIELAKFFKKVSDKGAKVILSNSDPRSVNANDDFFDELYSGFKINRILAKRKISANSLKRGKIGELLITNL